jgi:hypothetical protein
VFSGSAFRDRSAIHLNGYGTRQDQEEVVISCPLLDDSVTDAALFEFARAREGLG